MRVALACPYAWDRPGGVQVHVGQLAAALRSRGHQTLILAPSGSPADEAGVAVIGRAIGIPFNGSVAPISPDPRGVRRSRVVLRRFDPDVVHVHEPFSPSTSLFAALASTAPVVATFHSGGDRSRALRASAPFLRRVWQKLAVRIAVSEAARSFITRHFDGDVRIIPNGTDVGMFADAEPKAGLPSGRKLLFVGRLDPRKGFPVAVRAFGGLADAFPDLHLVVAGDGPERRAVAHLSSSVRRRVVMMGAVPHAELPPYHAAADVSAAPAIGRESFGLVLVEALAAGLPVVATDVPGYREVITDGVDGLLVPPGDPVALAEAVGRVLREPDLAARLSTAARARARDFSWDHVAGRIEAAYGDAVARLASL